MENVDELKDCKSIEELIPNISEDDAAMIIGMINGYQGQDIDATPFFTDLAFLKAIVEEAGAMEWLKPYLN